MASEKPFIGQMDRRITVYKQENTFNDVSEPVVTDVVVAKPWACMKEVSGSQEVDGKVFSDVTRSYTIRRHPGIAAKGHEMVITDRDVKYQVTYVREIERTHLELKVQVYE